MPNAEGRRIDFQITASPELTLPLHEDAALEALGALIENAARHARTTVRIAGGKDADHLTWLAIEDDGPGVPPDLRKLVLNRGRRLDERPEQHGLGLAIARDHVEASGGALRLGASELGGLRAGLWW